MRKTLILIGIIFGLLIAVSGGRALALAYDRRTTGRVEVIFRDMGTAVVDREVMELAPFPTEGRALDRIQRCDSLVLKSVSRVSFETVWKVLAYGYLPSRKHLNAFRPLSVELTANEEIEVEMFGAEWDIVRWGTGFLEKTPSFDITQVEDKAAFLAVMSRVDAGHPLDLVCDVESATGAQLVKALTLFRDNAKPGDKVYVVPK